MYLDNQFRLLREDMLAELRNGLQIALGQKKGRRSALLLRKLSAVGIFCGDEKRWKPCALGLQCQYRLESLTNMSPQRKEFLNENRNFLKHQSFGCLICGGEIVAFASVERNIDALIMEPPLVMLQISGDDAFKKTLYAFKDSKDLEFLLVDTPVFAYEPVLRCLQDKVDLPLAEELLALDLRERVAGCPLIPGAVVQRLKERSDENIQHILRTPKAIRLDSSQMESLIAELTHSLSLIQRPPGTIHVLYISLTKTNLLRHREVFRRRVARQSVP